MSLVLNQALKEWQVAVQALSRGETIVLLRKGGIREQQERFTVNQSQILLYPTYEHQQPDLLKPAYAGRVDPVAPGTHPETISLFAWATITDVLPVSEAEALAALLPFHIWNSQFATERLRWKPSQPLSVLLLRVFRLAQPQVIPYRESYGGCRSWITLETEVGIDEAHPALGAEDYAAQVAAILRALGVVDK